MPKSSQIRLQEFRAIYRLVEECRELGYDALAWRQHQYEVLGRMLGAGLVVGGELAGVTNSNSTFEDLGTAEWGWENGFDRKGWETSLNEFQQNPNCENIQAFESYLKLLSQRDCLTLSRTDLLSDAEWYRTFNFENINRTIGVDHTLWCFHSIPCQKPGEYCGVILSRELQDPDFSSRDKAIVEEVQRLFRPLVGGPLARFCDPSPLDLAPREREVLKCLLEGDGDKQIGLRIGLTRHTVNQYTKKIFRHFHVASRSELLAQWIQRGRSASFE